MQSRKLPSLLLIVSLFWVTAVTADTIAIIGTGDVAGALGPKFAAQGHTIIFGSRKPEGNKARGVVTKTGHGASATTPSAAAKDADIVVLAVPGMLVREITEGWVTCPVRSSSTRRIQWSAS